MDVTTTPPEEARSVIAFLKHKAALYSPREIFLTQWECLMLWFFSDVPGMPGFALRSLIYKILCRKVGGFVWIQPRVTLVHADRLCLGRMVGINSGTYINAVGGIVLGNHVMIGPNVTISSGQHPLGGRFPELIVRRVELKPIVIEDDVWIASGAVIMPGITLRRGTVIGANSVVMKSTEEYSIMAGSPACKVGSRDDIPASPA